MITVHIFVFYLFVNVVTTQKTNLCFGKNENLPCTKSKDCPWFQNNVKILRRLSANSIEKKEKLAELKSKVCGKAKQRRVCCPTEQTIIEEQVETLNDTSPSWVPSGSKGECGLDLFSGFIVGGEITKMGEFPWAVLLGKPSDKQSKWQSERQKNWYCGGTLINRWYVVSAAHCSPSQITTVRVGEWKVVDTSKPMRREGIKFSNNQKCKRCKRFRLVDGTHDCMDSTNNQFMWPQDAAGRNAECAPQHQDIQVDRVIVHPDYRRLISGLAVNDIMLVKLQRPVALSDYVRPACLPQGDFPRQLQDLGEKKIALRPVVVGWGRSYDGDYNETSTVASAFQQKLELPVVNNTECGDIWSNKFNKDVREEIRQENHLCAGGEVGKDSCKGDSGGPLVIRESDGAPTYLVGVVSGGTSICSSQVPTIFTRVTTSMQWILDNIK